MNLMESGAAWLGAQLKTAAGRTVEIHQGAQVLSGITAAPVERTYDVVSDDGILTSVTMTDWTIVAADLGGLTLREGAELHETLGGEDVIWEVMPVGPREAVEYGDTSGALLTAHTKRVT